MKTRTIKCYVCGNNRTVADGKELRRLRESAKMTLRELGSKIGFTAGYLSDIEFDRRTAPPKLLEFWNEKA